MANHVNPASLGIGCDWQTDTEGCDRPATTTFVMPDSDSLDAIAFFCNEHTAEFESPDNPFNEGWTRA
jgi:hypothetical protein